MNDLPAPARPPTPQALIHRLPDKAPDSSDAAHKPSKYIVLVTGHLGIPGKVQITRDVASALSCPSYIGDSFHASSAKAAGVGATPDAGPNEARYQRMWLSKMTRTGLLFPEESKPANEGFSGFGGGSSTATSRRGSASSVSSTTSNVMPWSGASSSKGEFVEAPSSIANPFFTLSEMERLRRGNPALLVLAHPELETWHKLAIRTALRDYRIGVIFVPLYEDEDDGAEQDDLPILRPLDPATMTSFPTNPGAPVRRPRGWGDLDEEIEVRVAQDADVDGKIRDIIEGVRDVMGIDE